MTDWRRWAPDATAGLLVFVLGLVQIDRNWYIDLTLASLAIVTLLAVAVGISRALPAAALALAWTIAAVHVLTGTDIMTVEITLAAVAFGCARWGSRAVLWLSAISIPAGALLVGRWIDSGLLTRLIDRLGLGAVADAAYRGGDWRVTIGLALLAVLSAPWLLGLALRFSARAEQSQASQQVAEAAPDLEQPPFRAS